MKVKLLNPITGKVNGTLTCEAFPRRFGYEVVCSLTHEGREPTFASQGHYRTREAAVQAVRELIEEYKAAQARKTRTNPLRHNAQGYWWGSRGPFPTRAKALQVARAAYAHGYKEKV